MTDDIRHGRITGETISWHHSSQSLSNACCLYCGKPFNGPTAPPSNKEHLIARNFVPSGTIGQQFNFIFRACLACNARKAQAERHISAVTLFNSPERATNTHTDDEATRKGRGDFHSRKKGVLIEDSGDSFEIVGKYATAGISITVSGPPQAETSAIHEVALSHIQGLFSLITTRDYRNLESIHLLPEDQFILFGKYSHRDWGNPQAVEIAKRVKDWPCYANISSAGGHFRAILRASTSGWFWALEWNMHLRIIGGISIAKMEIFENLPEEDWSAIPQGRMRRETPLDPARDILFAAEIEIGDQKPQ